jgi:hypothetical protein
MYPEDIDSRFLGDSNRKPPAYNSREERGVLGCTSFCRFLRNADVSLNYTASHTIRPYSSQSQDLKPQH